MGAGFAPVGTGGDDEGTCGIDQRIAPRIGTQQMGIGFDTIAQRCVALAGGQQAVGQGVVDCFD